MMNNYQNILCGTWYFVSFEINTFDQIIAIIYENIGKVSAYLTVQCLVPLSLHKLRCVPHKAADTPQPIQVLLVLDLNLNLNEHHVNDNIYQFAK